MLSPSMTGWADPSEGINRLQRNRAVASGYHNRPLQAAVHIATIK